MVDDVDPLHRGFIQDLEALGEAEAGHVQDEDDEPECDGGPKENEGSLFLTGVEVAENDVIIDQPVNCVRVFFLPIDQGEDQVEHEPNE